MNSHPIRVEIRISRVRRRTFFLFKLLLFLLFHWRMYIFFILTLSRRNWPSVLFLICFMNIYLLYLFFSYRAWWMRRWSVSLMFWCSFRWLWSSSFGRLTSWMRNWSFSLKTSVFGIDRWILCFWFLFFRLLDNHAHRIKLKVRFFLRLRFTIITDPIFDNLFISFFLSFDAIIASFGITFTA